MVYDSTLTHDHEMNDHLDIFGQQPFFTINTQICFCFCLTHTSSQTSIIQTLNEGLERLYAGFPWLACEVINEGSGEDNTGIYKFKALAEPPRIILKDLSHDASIPHMGTLRQANFPIRMLDENIIAPRKTFADTTESDIAPVFLIQANFIPGGLVLTFVAQHNTMDMTGQAHIMHLFSKACRNEPFTREDLSTGNLTRHNLVTLLDDTYTPGAELDRHMVKPNSFGSQSPPQKSTWAYFNFTRRSLTALKSRALEAVEPPRFISTDDALTAFIWQFVTRARLPRLGPKAQSSIARAVDVRKALGIPPKYPGPIQSSVYSTFTLRSLVEEPLGRIALELRSALDPNTSGLEFHSRAIATFLSRSQNKSLFSSTATFDLSADVILSSWAKENCYDLDFNLGLGKPESVRRPQFQAVEGLIFLMPKSLEGDIAVAVSLREEDMNRLRADSDFANFGTYIG
ncbi:hypothetical protein KAF25_001520 [Fusarium avenaceum]|uniref:Trichothecene 3-O-acetyltransferase-like N-terminal domain-containing protein n=1 Tax=Fusarium avenaceum TaxID=40199 RepID=A0A9P7KVU6_9HYPO|nr:hypothetical protein KAF25_001520 [Fusarium avenaceum]